MTQNPSRDVRFRSELLMGGAAVMALCSYAVAAPEGGQVVRGNVQFTRDGDTTIIRASDRSIINFRSFDLARHETVQFIQPTNRSSVLNRIRGDSPSFIDGSIIANGRVFFVNPAGITFGPNSVINVGTIVAGAGQISDADFLRDNWQFTGLRGSVINRGLINAETAVLLGRQVSNFGTINAPAGTVVMAAGDEVLVGRRRDRIFAKITAAGQAFSEDKVKVTNDGTINAPGGQVALSSADTFGAALFNAGTIRAKRATLSSGRGGVTRVTGVINTSDTQGQGGEVQVLGDRVELVGAQIHADGATGGGTILIGGGVKGQGTDVNATTTWMDSASILTADATQNGNGGTAVLWSDGVNLFSGEISVRGGPEGGNGGFVEVSGDHLGYYGQVDLSAPQGKGGSLLLDPRDLRIQAAGPAIITGVDEFTDSPNTDTIIGVGTITNILKTGGNVTLAANRDLFLETNINVVLDPGVLTGGDISMFAQRSISVSPGVNIFTAGGDLLLSANFDAGNIVSRGIRALNTGAGDITLGAGHLINVGTGTLTFQIGGVAGAFNQYQPGTLRNNGGSIGSGTTVIDGQFRGNTAVDDFLIAGGVINVTPGTRIDARNIGLTSLTGLNFLGAVSLNAGSGITLGAVSSGQVAGVSNLTIRNSPGGSGAPLHFAIFQFADITDANMVGSSQFGGTLPLSVSYESLGGSVTVTNPDRLNGTDGYLQGKTGVTINTGLVTMTLSTLNIAAEGLVTISSPIVTTNTRNEFIGTDPSLRTFSFSSFGTGGVGATFAMTAGGSITAAGNSYLEHSGSMELGSIDVGASTLTIKGSQNTAQSSGVLKAGTVVLDLAGFASLGQNNLVGTLRGSATNGISFRNAQALSIGDLQTLNFSINLDVDGAITQLAGTDVGTGDFNINSKGYSQQAGATLTVAGLSVVGASGDFIFDQAGNRTDVVAAQVAGKFHLVDLDDLAVGTVNGITGIDPSEVIIDAGGPLQINASITSSGLVSLRATDINQVGGTSITADQLAAVATGGGVNLFSSANDVNTFAGTTSGGALLFRDTDDVTIGSINSAFGVVSGVSTSGGNGTLRSGGLMTITNAINLGGGNTLLSLRSSGGANQTGGTITARELLVEGNGTFTLDQNNDVRRLAADRAPAGATLNLSLTTVNVNGLTIATINGTDGVRTGDGNLSLNATAGALAINRPINTGLGSAKLTGQGISQGANGTITAAGVALGGTGNINLTGATNTIGTLAGNFTGGLTLDNSIDTTIGTVAGVAGLTSNGGLIDLGINGALALNQGINAGAGNVSISAKSASNTGGGITAGSLELIGTAAGSFILDGANSVSTLAADIDGDFAFTNAGALTIGTAGATSGVDTNGHAITLQAGGAFLQLANINSGAATTLLIGSGFTQTSGVITAGNLGIVALGGGAWTMGGANDVDTLAAFTQGALTFNDTDSLTVGGPIATTFGTLNGILSSGNNVTLTSAGMTLDKSIDAGATGIVVLNSSLGVSQNASAQIIAHGLSLEGTGDFNLPGANDVDKLAAVIDGNLTINGSYAIGAVGSKPGINLSGSGNLTLQITGGPLEISSDIVIGGRLTLWGEGAFQSGGARIGADQLVIIGTNSNAFVLDTPSNNVNFVAAKLIGGMTLFDANTLTVNSVTGTPIGSISGIDVDPADILLVMPGTINLAAPISNPGARVTLQTAGATQALGANIVAGELALISNGAGVFNLSETTNAVGTVAGFFSGSGLVLQNTGGLTVGTIAGTPVGDLSGLFAPAQIVNISTTGLLTLQQGVVAAGLTTVSAGINQTGGLLITPQFAFFSGGNVSLEKANQVGTIAGSATGDVSFTNNQTLNVGTVGILSGITTGGGNLRLVAGDTTAITGFGIHVLAGDLNAGAGDITLMGSGFVQDAGTKVLGDGLGIVALGAGNWTFGNAGNDVNSLAGFTIGTLTFNDADDLAVGTASVPPFGNANGILSSDQNVNLTTGGPLTLNTSIDAGLGNITLTVAGGASQLGGILKAHGLNLQGSGLFSLTSLNQVGFLVGNISDSLDYVSAAGFTIGPVGGVNDLLSGGSISLTADGNIHIGLNQTLSAANRVTVTSTGMTQANNSKLLASELLLIGTGPGDFILTQAGNDVGTLAADIDGEINFRDANILTVGTVGAFAGIDVDPANVTLTMPGLLTLAAPIISPGTRITLNTGGVDQTGGFVLSSELVLVNFPGSGGDFNLFQSNNDVDTLVAQIGGNLDYRDFDDVTVGSLGGTPIGLINGINTTDHTLRLRTGGHMTLADNVNVGTSRARLITGNGIDQSGGIINADRLLLEGAGLIDLQLLNRVNILAGNFTGQLNFRNNQNLAIGSIQGVNGVTSNNNRVNLNVDGGLTLNNDLNVGTSLADIIAQGATQPTGLIIGGSLKLRGTGVFALASQNQVGNLAADISGPLNFTNAFGFNISTVDGVAGINTAGNNLYLIAGTDATGFQITQNAGANVVTTGARTVIQASAFDQSALASITADRLALIATADGNWTLPGANDANSFSAFTRGELLFNDVSTLTIETVVTGPNFGSVNGILSSNNAVTLRTGGLLTLAQSIDSGLGITTLDSAGGVGQLSGIVKAAGLSLQGTGAFNLPGANEANVLAADINGSLSYNSAIAYAIGTLNLKNGVSVAGGDIELCEVGGLLTIGADLLAPGHRITICAEGATQLVGTVIQSKELALIGTGNGDWDLDQPGNSVVTLAANVLGVLTYRDADGLDIGTLALTPVGTLDGITTNGHNLNITARGALAILDNVPVLAQNSRVTFRTFGASQGVGSQIFASELLLLGNGVIPPNPPGLGDFDLQSPLNNIDTIAGSTIGFIKYRNLDGLVVGSINGTDGLLTNNHDIYLRTDSGPISIQKQVNAGLASLVRLQTNSAPISQLGGADAALTAGRLLVRTDGPGGNVTLDNLNNQIFNVAALADGDFNLVSGLSLRVLTINDPLDGGTPIVGIDTVGITPGAGNIMLRVLGDSQLLVTQQLNAPTKTIRLQSDNGLMAQTDAPGDNPVVTAENFLLLSTGADAGAFFEWPANNVRNLAGNVGGELKYRDSGELFVTDVIDPLTLAVVSGVTTGDDNITITAQDRLWLERNVTAGTNSTIITRLRSISSDIFQTGGRILTGELRVTSAGQSLLPSAANDIDLLEALTDGGLNLENSVPLGIKKAISNNANIRISNAGLITLLTNSGFGEVNAGSADIAFLGTAGFAQQNQTRIVGNNLFLFATGAGAGNWILGHNNTLNDVNTLAANINGTLRFDDVDGLTVGQVGGIYSEVGFLLQGIVSRGGDAYLRSGTLGNLGGITINRPIDLSNGAANTATLRLQTFGGDIVQTNAVPDFAPITAGNLITLTAFTAGNVDLDNAFNRITNIAGDVGGFYHLTSSTDLFVQNLADPLAGGTVDGVRVLGNEAFVQAPALTVNRRFDASLDGVGSSLVRFTVDNLEITPTGFVRSGDSDSSGVWVRELTDGRNFRLGDELTSAIRLTQAEMLRIFSPLVQLGDSDAGDFTTSPAAVNLTTAGYDLVLRGRGTTITGGLLMNQQRMLTLWSELNGVSAPGQVTAGFLVLKGNGIFTLANATNDFGRMSADIVGPNIVPVADVLNVRDINSLIVDVLDTRLLDGTGIVNVTGIDALSGNVLLTTGSGAADRLTLWPGVADVDNILHAPDGSVFLTTNNLTINRYVDSGCRIFIAPVTATRPIIFGGAPGAENPAFLDVDDSEINRLFADGGLAVGGAAVSQIVVPGYSYTGSFIQLTGAQIDFTGGVDMTGFNALLNLVSPDVRQQAAGYITTDRLGLTGTGEFLLTASGNDFGLIAGDLGSLRLSDDNGFEVGFITVDAPCPQDPPTSNIVGLRATGSAALITRGLGSGTENNVFFSENVQVGDKLVLASLALPGQTPLFYQAVNTTVTAPNMLVNGRMDATLDQPFNNIANISGLTNGGQLTFRTNSNQNVTIISDFTFAPQAGDADQRTQAIPGGFDGLVNTGNIDLTATGRITLVRKLQGDELLIDSEGLGRTNGYLVANLFTFIGGADIALGVGEAGDGVDGVNKVKNMALLPTRVMTDVDFANDAVTPLNVVSGAANILNGRVVLRAREMTFTGPFTMAAAPGSADAEAGAVRITTDILDINSNLTGEGGILVRPLTSGTPISLGAEVPGQLSLSSAELSRLLTGRTVQIGSVTAGQITAGNLAALNYDLSLLGRGMTIGNDGLALTSGKTLYMNPQVTGVTQTGAISATNLLIIGNGAVNLANPSNGVSFAAINVNGAITFYNDIDLTIQNVAAFDLSARNRVAKSANTETSNNKPIINDVTANLTVGGDINAGTSTVVLNVTDVLDVLASKQVIGGAGITIDPTLMILGAGTKVLSANGLVDITTDGAQWDPSALISGHTGVVITTETSGRTIRLGGSSIFDNPGELGLSDDEMLVIGGDTPQVDINGKGAAEIIVSGDDNVADKRYIDLTSAPYDLVLRSNQPGGKITFFRGFFTSGETLRFIGPSFVRSDIILDTQSPDQNSVRFDGVTTFGLLGSLDVPAIDSRGVTLNFNGATVVNRTTRINTRVPNDAFANPYAGRLVFDGNVTGPGGLTLLTPLSQWAPTTDPVTNEPIFSRLPQIAFNTDPVTHEGRLELGFLRINADRNAQGQFIDGQPVRNGRPPIPTIVFNYNGFVTGDVGAYAMELDSDFSTGPREQFLMYGPMDITAGGGMLLSDINVLGDPGTTNNSLRLTVGPQARIDVWTRQRRNDDPATSRNEFDIGTSIVVQGFVDVNGVDSFNAVEEPSGAGNNNFIFVMRPQGSKFTSAVNSQVQRRLFSTGDQIDIRRVREGGLNQPPSIAPFELALNSFPIGFIQATGDDELNLADALAAALAVKENNEAAGAQGNLTTQQIDSLARLSIFVRRPGGLELMPTRFGKIIIDTSRNPHLTEDGRFLRSTNPRDYNVAEPRLTEQRVDRLLADFDSMFGASLDNAEAVKAVVARAWDAYAASAGNAPSGSGFRGWLEGGNDAEALGLINRARDLFSQLDQLGLSETELVFPKRTVAGLLAPKPELVGAMLDAIGATPPSVAAR